MGTYGFVWTSAVRIRPLPDFRGDLAGAGALERALLPGLHEQLWHEPQYQPSCQILSKYRIMGYQSNRLIKERPNFTIYIRVICFGDVTVRSKVSDQKCHIKCHINKCQINKIIVANLFIGEIAADIVYIKKLNLQELDLSTQHDNEPPSDIFDVGDVVPFPRFL